MTRPFAALGSRLLSAGGNGTNGGIFSSFVLGIATGFLWAPCAGPILGLILTGAAINGPNAQTTLLLLAYALGGITSLAVATLTGSRVFAALKHSFGAGEWLRRGLGVAVIIAVVAIAFGWDTGVLTRLSLTSTNRIEQSLIDVIHPNASAEAGHGAMTAGAITGGAMMSNKAASSAFPMEGELPALDGAVAWLNSSPLTPESLHGKVVVIDFWTYSCINWRRTLPYVSAWAKKYKDQGLVVIGVHAPEFSFESDNGAAYSSVSCTQLRGWPSTRNWKMK